MDGSQTPFSGPQTGDNSSSVDGPNEGQQEALRATISPDVAAAITLMEKNAKHHFPLGSQEIQDHPEVIAAAIQYGDILPTARPGAITTDHVDLAIEKIKEIQASHYGGVEHVTDVMVFEALQGWFDRMEKKDRDPASLWPFGEKTVGHVAKRFLMVPDAEKWAIERLTPLSAGKNRQTNGPPEAVPASSLEKNLPEVPGLTEQIDQLQAASKKSEKTATEVPPETPRSAALSSEEGGANMTFNTEAPPEHQAQPSAEQTTSPGPLPRESELPPETPQSIRAMHRLLSGLHSEYSLNAEKKKLQNGALPVAAGTAAGGSSHGGGGRSFLSIGGGGGSRKETKREMAAAQQAYAAMEGKAVDTLMSNLFHQASEMGSLRLGLKEGIENLNQKVSQDPDFTSWMAKVDDYAASKGMTRSATLDKVYAGDLPGFGEGLRKIAEKPELAEMLKNANSQADDLAGKANDITNTLDSLRRKNIDVSKLEPVFEKMQEESSVPDAKISDPDSKRRLDKLSKETEAQMRKILEAITKAIKKIIDKIRGTFGR